ncbi:DUF433 domain-containing protein [Fervidobacterium sp.]
MLAGQPVLRGTRLSVAYILRLLASGATVEKILQEYEGLRPKTFRRACCLRQRRENNVWGIIPVCVSREKYAGQNQRSRRCIAKQKSA